MATSELLSAIDSIGDSFKTFKDSQGKRLDQLSARLDQLDDAREQAEALLDRPKAGAGADLPGGTLRFETSAGPMFNVPSNVKLASIKELNQKAAPEISLERWLAATVAGERCGDKVALEFAREKKQMVTTSTGVLIPAEYQTAWVDMLRARSVLNTAGMRTVPMTAKTQVHSAVTADPTAGWHTEAGSINAANPTFAARTLTAQTLVTRCQASVELAQDSPDFGAQLARVMTGAMAAEVDRAGLEGSGTPPTPRGIKNTSGRSSQTSTGALTDFEEIVSGIGALLAANCDLSQVSKFAIMSPGSWAAYENLVTGISSDKTQLPRPRSVQDMQFLVTSNIAGNISASPQVLSTIYLGDFRDLLLGVRLESSIEVLKLDTYAGNLLLEFVGYTRCDFVATRPASFHTVESVLS